MGFDVGLITGQAVQHVTDGTFPIAVNFTNYSQYNRLAVKQRAPKFKIRIGPLAQACFAIKPLNMATLIVGLDDVKQGFIKAHGKILPQVRSDLCVKFYMGGLQILQLRLQLMLRQKLPGAGEIRHVSAVVVHRIWIIRVQISP